MNHRKIILEILVVVLVITVAAFAQPQGRVAVISDFNGKVDIRIEKDKSWYPAVLGLVLHEGDIVRTGADSILKLNLDGQEKTAVVLIKEKSELLIAELIKIEDSGEDKTLLDLAIGKIFIEVDKLRDPEAKFEVKTPTSMVGVRGTEFSVEVNNLNEL